MNYLCGHIPKHTIMDTSKKYYEDKIQEFNRHRRGRTLSQFCRDEGIDYEWMLKAKRKYSGRAQQTPPEESASETDILPSLIELHYEDDSESHPKNQPGPSANGWSVGAVILTDPNGNEITISCGSAAALGSLLTKLSECHA